MSHDLRISAKAEKSPAKIENKFKIEGGSKLEVFDEDGGKLYEGEFKSFTANFLKLLYGSMIGAGTAKAKDISGNNLEMNSFPQDVMNIKGGAGVKKFGLVVGTNTAAVSVSDYNITVPASLTVNDTVVSASSVGADFISVEISRQISNGSGSPISLKEAGLICGLDGETDTNVLIARDLLNFTLDNGKKSIWRYTINFNFANDVGGFIKTFADSIFNGIFKEISSASWAARTDFGCCVHNGKIWVMGGTNSSNTRLNDVWYSEDGEHWYQATASASWSARAAFGCCVHNGKMWVMGGTDSSNTRLNDVWCSEDGANWTQVTISAPMWSTRDLFAITVHNGKMWVMGGRHDYSRINDVWYSEDGEHWYQATASASWSARSSFIALSFNDKLWIIGGWGTPQYKNDVWYSEDGEHWYQATASADWQGRQQFSGGVFNSKMLIMGGNDGSQKNDVWYSEDGEHWYQATASASWSARVDFDCCVYDNKMWVMGGQSNGSKLADVYAMKFLTAEIKPGSSDTPFSATGMTLGALIADGSGSGQLVYGAMPGAATTEPSVSGNKIKMSIAREFTNNSGADITVREVGLFSGTDMLARLILANPVTIPNGGSEIITVDFETEV